MAAEKQKLNGFWDAVALEAEDDLTLRTEKWRKTARNWLAHYVEHKARHLVLQTIEEQTNLKSDAQVLDVGCGPGKWVNIFAKKGLVTTGIDASPWMIRLAKKRLGRSFKETVRLYVANAARLGLSSCTYDLVNCVTVLQHILNDEEWKSAVHEMVRVAKPSGYILIFEAAPSFGFKGKTRHLRFRTMKDYVREFDKAGASFVYWRATDLSFPITFLGLRKYAASFSRKAYYYSADSVSPLSPRILSLLSRMAVLVAHPIDYRLAKTPLSLLSVGKILLFRKLVRGSCSKSETEAPLTLFHSPV